MNRLFLIRHGQPEAAWGAADDPGLSALGRAQAEAAARHLTRDRALALVSSPMLRCRETARPLERALDVAARIEPRVSEVATPSDITDRRAWLAETFPWRDGVGLRDWSTLTPALRAWRDDVLAAVRGIDRDTAIFTHFIAINTIVGAAKGRGETIVCRPGFASITELVVEAGALRVVRLGAEMTEGDVR